MRPEEGRLLDPGVARQAQRPRLVVHGEPVAGLDLDGGRALRAHLEDAVEQQVEQLLVGRGAGGGHGHGDPAPVVGLPRHPRRELLAAVPREHQVGVRVDESRHHATAPDGQHLVGRGCVGRAPHPGDVAAVGHRLALDHPVCRRARRRDLLEHDGGVLQDSEG